MASMHGDVSHSISLPPAGSSECDVTQLVHTSPVCAAETVCTKERSDLGLTP